MKKPDIKILDYLTCLGLGIAVIALALSLTWGINLLLGGALINNRIGIETSFGYIQILDSTL